MAFYRCMALGGGTAKYIGGKTNPRSTNAFTLEAIGKYYAVYSYFLSSSQTGNYSITSNSGNITITQIDTYSYTHTSGKLTTKVYEIETSAANQVIYGGSVGLSSIAVFMSAKQQSGGA